MGNGFNKHYLIDDIRTCNGNSNIMDHSPHNIVDIDYVRQSRGPLLHVNLTIYGA